MNVHNVFLWRKKKERRRCEYFLASVLYLFILSSCSLDNQHNCYLNFQLFTLFDRIFSIIDCLRVCP